MALTLAEATELRTAYYEALKAIATGKSYTIGSRTLTRADEKFISQKFTEYDQLVEQLTDGATSSGIKVFRVIPRDT